ncbi:MAG: DUF2752 domain-containing protein [Crocinitomicaceae bacterium]|nr:DUF2752 domain-containing protein [Crocinitomicaceae bacterium]
MIACSWRSNFGIDCLTCGFQRSFQLLLEGDVIRSVVLFPATIPFLLTILFLTVHLFFKFKHGARALVWLFASTTGLIVLNYTVKLMNCSAFH